MSGAAVITHANAETVARAAASVVLGTASTHLSRSDRCVILLSGGRTPRAMHTLLSQCGPRDRDLLRRVHWFVGDERRTPHSSADSNSGVVVRELLDPLGVPAPNRQLCLDDDAAWTAEPGRLESVLRFVLRTPRPRVPSPHLVLLGMGSDGHVASLFPGSRALEEEMALFTSATAPPPHPVRERLTATLPLLNAAARIVLLVTGAEKAEAVALALRGKRDRAVPASLLPRGKCTWLLDKDAAAEL